MYGSGEEKEILIMGMIYMVGSQKDGVDMLCRVWDACLPYPENAGKMAGLTEVE